MASAGPSGPIPLGMGLLLLQALAELHKRLSFLFDIGPDPLAATGTKDAALVKDDKELPA